MLTCLLRREYTPGELVRQHPPVFRHSHKRAAFEMACPVEAVHRGHIVVTRWSAAELPTTLDLGNPLIACETGVYDYRGSSEGVWHVNFADPRLFVAYGSPLLAQDELQAVEHPLLGSIREALLAANEAALTVDKDGPTPVLVTGVERRCMLATDVNDAEGRPLGLYGNQFARASVESVRRAIRLHERPKYSNLIAMAAPTGAPGPYFSRQLRSILVTAYTGFVAAREESTRTWPGARCEVRTGFWGCGAFGGNRQVMTLLQLLAARLARVDSVQFFAFDAQGVAEFQAGAAALERVLESTQPGEALEAVLTRIDDLDYEWGHRDGT